MAVGGSWLILGGGGFAVVVGCESCDGDGGSDLVGWGGVGGWVGGWVVVVVVVVVGCGRYCRFCIYLFICFLYIFYEFF